MTHEHGPEKGHEHVPMNKTSAAKDPVCGMTVDPTTARASTVYDGQTYFFCCPSCRTKFEQVPERYLNQPGQSSASGLGPRARAGAAGLQAPTTAAHYTCPMHPDVRQDQPGSCPKCGMALEREMVAPPATRIEYTCPMHPQIIRDRPANCPICGMALEPRTVAAPARPCRSWGSGP